jgi:WD40 repeat protein
LSIETDYVNLLRELPCAKDAGYRSGGREPCLKGTRVEILHEIEKWAADKRENPVLWLSGVAGSGKTTVAQSFAERVFAEGRLGASFFCSRGITDRSNIDIIFTTLAFEFATQFHEFRPIIAKVIKDNPKVGHESLAYQLKKIIIDPLQYLIKKLKADPNSSTRLPIVFIIDALDECEDHHSESAVLSVLSTQLEFMDYVRILITSRPVDQIRAAFRRPKLDKLTRRLQLHKVDPSTIDRDMRMFFQTRLPQEVENREDFTPPQPWPAADQVSILVNNSGGLFVYASTILKFIISRDHDPDERLRIVIAMVDTFLTGKLGIDQLYVQLLLREFANSEAGDSDVFSAFRLVVGCILLVFNPVSLASLAKILEKTPPYILRVLRHLHSVLIIPDSASDLITAAHRSFPDFLTDSSRCDDNRFYVDRSGQHAMIGIQCLKLMMKDLKRDMCSIPEHMLNNEVEDLPRIRLERIDPALEYACRFFGKHVYLAPLLSQYVGEVVKWLRDFIERRFLQWLELLSIVGDLRAAVHSLNDIKWWLVNVNPLLSFFLFHRRLNINLQAKVDDEDLTNYVIDCHRFVLKFFDSIEESAGYIYDVALPWCPVSSPLRQRYSEELATKVKVVKGLDHSWDLCSRTINTGDHMNSVAFSHDGRLIAGAGSAKLQIYEAATGACLTTIHEPANSIAISPHDALLMSASGRDAKLWDVRTGEMVRAFNGHTDEVYLIALSHDGVLVATGANDYTVRIWDLSTGNCDAILEGNSSVRSICWLKEGNQILSGLGDGTINAWDVVTKTRLNTTRGHDFAVSSLASSSQGDIFASASHVDSIQIYDARTFELFKTFLIDEPVYSIFFSPKGDRIVYSAGKAVHIQDLQQESTKTTYKGNEMMVSSAVFAPDGSTIASASRDGNIKFWQCEDEIAHENTPSFTVIAVCISEDGQKIISGSVDETIMIWNVHTGECLETIRSSRGDAAVYAIALSPTNSLVVSRYEEKKLRLWDYRNPELSESAMTDTYFPFMRFSLDGSQMIASGFDNFLGAERWEVCLSPLGLRCIGTEDISLEEPYHLSSNQQWILDREGKRVCWLPPERRSSYIHCSDSKVVLAGSRDITILDLRNARS